MLQLRIKDNNQIAIVPHVRFLGNWEDFVPVDTGIAFDNKDGQLVFIEVIGNLVSIKIQNYKYTWFLPTHAEARIIQHDTGSNLNSNTPKIWFRNRYGKIGFRAQGGKEKGVIGDLKIDEL